jgi:hypothetical protein
MFLTILESGNKKIPMQVNSKQLAQVRFTPEGSKACFTYFVSVVENIKESKI